MHVVVSMSALAGLAAASASQSTLMDQMQVDLDVEEQVHGELHKVADTMGFSVDTSGTAYVSWKQLKKKSY